MNSKNTSWAPHVYVISDGWAGKPETREARLELHLLVDGVNSGVLIYVHADNPTLGTLTTAGVGAMPASGFGGPRRGDVGELAAFAESCVSDGRIYVGARPMTEDEKADTELTR